MEEEGEEDDEVIVCASQDEAIALAMADAAEGDEIVIHDEDCALQVGECCTCEPLPIVVRWGYA